MKVVLEIASGGRGELHLEAEGEGEKRILNWMAGKMFGVPTVRRRHSYQSWNEPPDFLDVDLHNVPPQPMEAK